MKTLSLVLLQTILYLFACSVDPKTNNIDANTRLCLIDTQEQAVALVTTKEPIEGEQMLALVETWDKRLMSVKVSNLRDTSACDSLRWK